jgi:hypothetical protein
VAFIDTLKALVKFEVDDKGLKAVSNRLDTLQTTIAGVVGGATVAAIGKGLFSLAENAAAFGEEVEKAMTKFGIGAEEFQVMSAAAKAANVDIGTVQMALKKAGSAKNLEKISEQLLSIPDEATRNKKAIELLGRSGVEMIPVLMKLDETRQMMHDFGLTISDDGIKNLAKFDDSLDKVAAIFDFLRKMIGAEIAPIFEELVESFLKFWKANQLIIKQQLGQIFQGMAKAFSFFVKIGMSAVNMISGFMDKFSGVSEIAFILTGIVTAMGLVATAIGVINLVLAPITGTVLLIAGAIAAAFLIAEDLWAFFTDPEAETLTGLLVEKFGQLKDLFFSTFPGVGKFLDNIIIPGFKLWWEYVNNLYDVLMSIAKFVAPLLIESFNAVFSVISGTVKLIAGVMDKIYGFIGNNVNLNELLPTTPGAGPVGSVGTSGQSFTSNQSALTAPITVNVPAGSDPNTIGNAVQRGAGNAFDQYLRDAQQSNRSSRRN